MTLVQLYVKYMSKNDVSSNICQKMTLVQIYVKYTTKKCQKNDHHKLHQLGSVSSRWIYSFSLSTTELGQGRG
jgi:hypothetical protein